MYDMISRQQQIQCATPTSGTKWGDKIKTLTILSLATHLVSLVLLLQSTISAASYDHKYHLEQQDTTEFTN